MSDSDTSGSSDELLDAITALVPTLMNALDGLSHAGRYLHPPVLQELLEVVEPLGPPLAEAVKQFDEPTWPEHMQAFRETLLLSADQALKAYSGLAEASQADDGVMSAYRALRFSSRAREALYPVAAALPPVSRFFLDPRHRDDQAIVERAGAADTSLESRGVMHVENDKSQRGGFSLYVPEYLDESERYPVVFALHGGSGHGRDFFWSWLPYARSHGFVLVAPTSSDRTWSLMEPETDSARLKAILDYAHEHWPIDGSRQLITGMSDGGTFSWLEGLFGDAGFTHIAPVSASFHPMILEGAEADRVAGLPVYLAHGALDWMFEVDSARAADRALRERGASVIYRELADLSHTYPVAESGLIGDWLRATPVAKPA